MWNQYEARLLVDTFLFKVFRDLSLYLEYRSYNAPPIAGLLRRCLECDTGLSVLADTDARPPC